MKTLKKMDVTVKIKIEKRAVRICEKRQKKNYNYFKNIKDEESNCNFYDRKNFNDFQGKKKKNIKKDSEDEEYKQNHKTKKYSNFIYNTNKKNKR